MRSMSETHVILIASKRVMYDFAVRKLHDPDSHRTPFACAIMPTIDSTAHEKSKKPHARTHKGPNTYEVL